MSCPIEFETKKTVNPCILIGMGGFIWFFSSVVVAELFRPYFSIKMWEDVYILGTKLIQVLCLAGFIVGIGIDIPAVMRNWMKQWREHLRIAGKYLGVYLGALLAVLTVGVIILILLEKTGRIDPAVMGTMDGASEIDDKILYLKRVLHASISRYILSLGITCVVAPIIEEIFFRRFLFVALRKRMDFSWALGISAVLFMVIHPNMAQGAIGGIYLGYVYEKGKSLPANILIHGMANFIITTASMMVRQ